MKLETGGDIRLANRIYDEKLKSRLEPKHIGEIVAIHVQTGDHFLGSHIREACAKGRAAHPEGDFVCRRVGDAPVYRIGAF